jgi:Flp pilus assembly protein TadG
VSVRDRGAVTAETALALPTLAVVAAALVALGHVAVAQLRCVDAARAAARLAARGEPPAVVRARAEAAGPTGASVAVRGGRQVAVLVTAPVALPFGMSLQVASEAVADAEDLGELSGTAP